MINNPNHFTISITTNMDDSYIHWEDTTSGSNWEVSYPMTCPTCNSWINNYVGFKYCPYCGVELFPKKTCKLCGKELDE